MNYLVLNRPSNLITGVVASQSAPRDSRTTLFIPANETALKVYYRWLSKNPGLCPDVGEVAARSASVREHLTRARSGDAQPVSENLNRRYREPAPAKVEDREGSIREYILAHPDADPWALHDRFQCGSTAGAAYLQRYSVRAC